MSHLDIPSLPPLPRPLPTGHSVRRETLTLGDGYITSVYVHEPPVGPVCLPVLHVHGIQSHPGWFMTSAEALARAGHQVYQVTRRGSGDNTAARGHAHSPGQLLDDVDCACRMVLERTGAARLHLMGVSWGGKLLAAHASHPNHSAAIASLTMIAPGIVPKVDVAVTTKLSIALAMLVWPHRRFAIPLSEPELFTDTPAMREYLRNDKLSLHEATAKFFLASRRLDWRLASAPDGCLKMPVTLILAGTDRIIDNAGTRQVVNRLSGGRCNVAELSGCHVLEFEHDPQPLIDALVAATQEEA